MHNGRISWFWILAGMFLSVISTGCGSVSALPGDYADTALIFGKGGGFTGQQTEYLMLKNGQVFAKDQSSGTYIRKGGVSRQTAQQAFHNFRLLGFDQYVLNTPGNTYSYIIFQDPEEKCQLTWGDPGNPVPPDLQKYHRTLFEITQRLDAL